MTKKKKWVVVIIVFAIIAVGAYGYHYLTTPQVRDDDVADKTVSKLTDPLLDYTMFDHPEGIDTATAENNGGVVSIRLSFKGDSLKKKSFANRMKLQKMNYALAGVQRKAKVKGAVSVNYYVDDERIATAANLYGPIHYVTEKENLDYDY
ncbi:hypothetical protein KCA1_2942 [Lactiplantibacillus pentosus KCA1]|nr:hypothetical protein [Lactiplantibacillus pentosus]EIW12543.1 hypothetical protein KCA1_2942 [Lactiplantibacillus pentosus KCA1]